MSRELDLIRVRRGRTVLAAATAVEVLGPVELRDSNTRFLWTGEGSAAWEVDVLEQGPYEVSLCYSAFARDTKLEVTSGRASIADTVGPTTGVFGGPESRNLMDFERVLLNGTLDLEAGRQRVILRVLEPKSTPVLSLFSIELTPLSAKGQVAAEEEVARQERANVDWFVQAGYGLMFHWTSQSKPRYGAGQSYHDAVRKFEVERFADMVASTGAGYVMFTANHAEPHFPAPLRSWGKYYPGWTTSRDLIAELASALEARGVKLMLYLNTFASYITLLPEPTAVGNCSVRMSERHREEYLATTCEILEEIGRRYGNSLAGYWFDSWYQPYQHFGSIPTRPVFQSAKVGNPNRILALNHWIFPVCSPWQEYWAGEVASPCALPKEQYFADGPGKGLLYHALLVMEDGWVHDKAGTEISRPRFDSVSLSRYIGACMEKGGVVTINLKIYQDGEVSPRSLAVMEGIRQTIRGC